MSDLLPGPIKNAIDSMFAPLDQFLQLIIDHLDTASLVTGHGINLNNYLGFFAYLPSSWQSVLQSLLASVGFLAVLFLVRAAWNLYLKAKGSIPFLK